MMIITITILTRRRRRTTTMETMVTPCIACVAIILTLVVASIILWDPWNHFKTIILFSWNHHDEAIVVSAYLPRTSKLDPANQTHHEGSIALQNLQRIYRARMICNDRDSFNLCTSLSLSLSL